MISPVAPNLNLPETNSLGTAAAGAQAAGFADIMSQAVDRVELSQAAANEAVSRFVSGEGDDLHSTALAVQRAELEFQMMLQMRNKVVQAYQEIMRMQV